MAEAVQPWTQCLSVKEGCRAKKGLFPNDEITH